MSASNGSIYAVTLTIEPETVEAFDQWLARHVGEILENSCDVAEGIFSADPDKTGRARRIVHFCLKSESHLEHYLADPASDLQRAARKHFAGKISVCLQILRETGLAGDHIQVPENCLNCQTALHGQYCGNCGQRSGSRLISLWELISDAFGDLFELDSRIWSTMRPLLLRPGKLTHEYLQGRRARFMPPFRTYLVLSIVFFVVLLFDPQQEFGLLFEPAAETSTPATGKNDVADNADQKSPTDKKAEPVNPSGTIIREAPSNTGNTRAAQDQQGSMRDGLVVEFGHDTDLGEPVANCDMTELENMDLPFWLARRLTRERLLVICEKITADNGRALLGKLQDNIPAALFFLLPLMALVLRLLYPLSRRYYVEHLLFVVHFHAFFFLILILQILFSRLGILLRLPETLVKLVLFITSIYIPVYLYRAMRRVYGQGHLASVPKFFALLIAYCAGILTIFGIAALLAAFAI